MEIKDLKIGYVIKVDSCKVKKHEGKRILGEVQVLKIPSPKSKFVLVESPDLLANILVPIKDCFPILNHSMSCTKCDNWEEMGADDSRDNFTGFTCLKLNNDGTAIYKCNECNNEGRSEIFNKEDL